MSNILSYKFKNSSVNAHIMLLETAITIAPIYNEIVQIIFRSMAYTLSIQQTAYSTGGTKH